MNVETLAITFESFENWNKSHVQFFCTQINLAISSE